MPKNIVINANGKSKEEIIKIIGDALDERVEEIEKEKIAAKLEIKCSEDLEKHGFGTDIGLQGSQEKLFRMLVVGVYETLINLNQGEKNTEFLLAFINSLTDFYISYEKEEEE